MQMPFSATERQALLSVKGVGPTVVDRLEQLGFHSLPQLSEANALQIVSQAAAMLGSSCWKNSPQARAAIAGAIALAKQQTQPLAGNAAGTDQAPATAD